MTDASHKQAKAILDEAIDSLSASLWIDYETGNLAILACPADVEEIIRRRQAGLGWRQGGYPLVRITDPDMLRSLRGGAA
jgi:hypothetical protein